MTDAHDNFTFQLTAQHSKPKQWESLFHIINHVECSKPRFSLRPNRCARHWFLLMRATTIFYILFWTCCVCFYCVAAYLTANFILTKRGFEQNYPYCVMWIRSLDSPSDYSNIYRPPINESMPADTTYYLPWTDYNELTSYHLSRYVVEIFDSHLILYDSAAACCACIHLLLVLVADIMIYAIELKHKLKNLISKLRHPSLIDLSGGCGRVTGIFTAATFDEFLYIQTILEDYFAQLAEYNRYVEFFSIVSFGLWGTFTTLVSVAMVRTLDMASRILFASWVALAAVAFLTILVMISLVSALGYEIYSLTTTVISLDNGQYEIRRRWPSILLHFIEHTYCFNIFGGSEISLSLSLKVS